MPNDLNEATPMIKMWWRLQCMLFGKWMHGEYKLNSGIRLRQVQSIGVASKFGAKATGFYASLRVGDLPV
jgi:hypothetical protein